MDHYLYHRYQLLLNLWVFFILFTPNHPISDIPYYNIIWSSRSTFLTTYFSVNRFPEYTMGVCNHNCIADLIQRTNLYFISLFDETPEIFVHIINMQKKKKFGLLNFCAFIQEKNNSNGVAIMAKHAPYCIMQFLYAIHYFRGVNNRSGLTWPTHTHIRHTGRIFVYAKSISIFKWTAIFRLLYHRTTPDIP